jgi:hypothetical protein
MPKNIKEVKDETVIKESKGKKTETKSKKVE